MPEGDTVRQVAARLRAALAGRPLTRSDLRVPRHATADLTGRTVNEVVPRGKHLLIRLGGGLTLHSHLLMDGAWRVFGPGERRPGPSHQIRAELETARSLAVGYRVHELKLVRTADEELLVGHLGPDLLGPDWDAEQAVRNLADAPDRPIAEALLDQRNLAGIGNIYKAEILFTARVHPWTPSGSVDLPKVVEQAQRLLHLNRDRARRVTTSSPFEPLWVYGRAGRPCLRCGTRVNSVEQGTPPRLTYWCPHCQPTP